MLAAVANGTRNGEGGTEPNGDPPGSAKPLGHSGLVGAGASRVGISGAMRARDVSRVRPEDLAEAERDVRIRHAAPMGGHPQGPSAQSAKPPQPNAPTPSATPRPKPGPVPAPPPRRDRHAGGT